MIKFKCKDFLLKERELEAKGAHSVDEMMRRVKIHQEMSIERSGSRRRRLKRFGPPWRNRLAPRNSSVALASSIASLIFEAPSFWSDATTMPPQLLRRWRTVQSIDDQVTGRGKTGGYVWHASLPVTYAEYGALSWLLPFVSQSAAFISGRASDILAGTNGG